MFNLGMMGERRSNTLRVLTILSSRRRIMGILTIRILVLIYLMLVTSQTSRTRFKEGLSTSL